jgi:hypothetical protein
MKTDVSDGASANDKLEERLAGLFATELDRAEHDYPALGLRGRGAAENGRRRRTWPRLLAVPVGIAALLLVVIVGSPLLMPSAAPVAPAPGSSDVSLGNDGIPTRIGGQRVYRVADQAEWQNLSGSFLLGSYAVDAAIPCASPLPSTHPQSSAEADLVPQCGVVELVPLANGNSEYFFNLAPRGLEVLTGWLNGPAVVMRVHTHDPEAAGCSADQQAGCEAAVVVEAVVWPVVPTEIDGQRVYRAADQASFASLSGSFLLGGPFTKPEFVPPCPMPVDKSAAEQQLIPYCYLRTIDGLQVAPESNIDEPNDEMVVARVHVNDPLAAQCPADVRAQCQAGIVVEAVVWRGATVQVSPTPSVAPPTSGNAASSEVAGPSAGSSGTGAVQLGPDGVPTAVGGEEVYRASNLSTSVTFLLGGKLTLDVSPCPSALPAATVANPPDCGYWMLDGVKVGTNVDPPDSLREQIVVARVDRSGSPAVCPGVGCSPTETTVIAQIVWQTLTPPPPLVPSAS